MKKPIHIVSMLAVVMILMSAAVFFVEGITTPIIEQRRAEEIEAALQTIFPSINGATDTVTSDTTVDFGTTGITDVLVIKTGDNVKGYVYTVTFQGFASQITYLLGIDAQGMITGYQTISQNDTAGYGAQIADPVNWTQFTGMSIETAGNGEFDGLSGASVTTGAWKTSFNTVYNFHLDTYGYTPLTEEQLRQLKKESMVDSAYTVSPYTTDNPYASYGITAIDVANDGTTDQAVIYTVSFVGFNTSDNNEYLIAFDLNTNEVIGFITLYSGDSTDYGAAKLYDQTNWTQFDGASSDDLLNPSVDGFSGASITGNALEVSLQQLSVFHQWEFQGVVVLTPSQRFELYKEELFADAETFEDVTALKPAHSLITTIFDAYDAGDDLVGTVYHVTTIGASYSGFTYLEFLIGIDTDGNFTGFRLFDDNETAGKTDPFYVDGYGDTIVGDAIDDALALDAVAGSTITYNRLVTAIAEVVTYHQDKYYSRPDPIPVDTVHLTAAFPTAVSFTSVYENYAVEGAIGNLYAAKDGSDATIGYVYFATASGNGGPITFTWGVANDGTTQQLHIISDSETWSGAAGEYGDYNGSYGTNFPTSTWLSLFEGIDIATVISSPFDSVAGVTNTTAGMIAILETIAQYHADEAVGGGN